MKQPHQCPRGDGGGGREGERERERGGEAPTFSCADVRLDVDALVCTHAHPQKVLSVVFNFDNPEETYEFAYCYPYTYSRLQDYLERLAARGMPYFTRERSVWSGLNLNSMC